jgi:peptide deformylase
VAVRDVLRYPHAALKSVARPVRPDEEELVRRVAGDLVDTMRQYKRCVGLAAPQIDELVRMVAIDCSDHPKATRNHGLLVLVNPRIAFTFGGEVAREGCLSIPDLTANVRRATHVVVEARRPDGRPVAIEADGFEARCLQHELDHLDGVLFLDRVESVATDVFRRKRYA